MCIYIYSIGKHGFSHGKTGLAYFLGYLYRPDYAGSLTGADICLCLIHLTWDGEANGAGNCR